MEIPDIELIVKGSTENHANKVRCEEGTYDMYCGVKENSKQALHSRTKYNSSEI